MGRRKFFIFFIVCFSLPYCFAAYCKSNAAQPRATEILERLAAGFREMDGYGVKFEGRLGRLRSPRQLCREGDSYYLVLGDAEVFRRRSRAARSTTAAAR